METYRWERVPREQPNPLLARQAIHTEHATIARIYLRAGSVVPEHDHASEQLSTLESGALRFVIGGVELVMKAGDMVRIPPNVPHSVEALEDSVAVDLFAPRREDWIRGDDAYLRG